MSLYNKKEWVGCSYYYSEKWIKEAIKELMEDLNFVKERNMVSEVIIKIFGADLCSEVEE